MNHAILYSKEIFICDLWILYPQQELHIRYMDPKYVLALIFASAFNIAKLKDL